MQVRLKAFRWLTLDRFRTRSDAIVRAVYLFSLHNNILETFVICVEAMLQQLTESHRAAWHRARYGSKSVENLQITLQK